MVEEKRRMGWIIDIGVYNREYTFSTRLNHNQRFIQHTDEEILYIIYTVGFSLGHWNSFFTLIMGQITIKQQNIFYVFRLTKNHNNFADCEFQINLLIAVPFANKERGKFISESKVSCKLQKKKQNCEIKIILFVYLLIFSRYFFSYNEKRFNQKQTSFCKVKK